MTSEIGRRLRRGNPLWLPLFDMIVLDGADGAVLNRAGRDKPSPYKIKSLLRIWQGLSYE